jgi:formylglycine-generating enzyme required for sulfatase activity
VIWDFAGNVWEWTQGFIAGGQQPGLSGQTSYTGTEWNNSSLLMNGLPAIDKPSYGTPSAVNWTTTQGIGLVYSNPSEPATRAFVRGGSWGSALYAGVSYVGTGSANTPDSSTGFRVTQ